MSIHCLGRRLSIYFAQHVALDDGAGKLRKLTGDERRAGAVRRFSARWGRETQGDGRVEIFQRGHLPIKPLQRIRPMPIGPTDAGAQFLDTEFLQPFHGEIQTMVFKMKPLADSQFRIEMTQRRFRRAVRANESKIEVPVVRAAFALFVAGRSFPLRRQVEQAVPENTLCFTAQQFRGALQAEHLHFIRAERRYAHFGDPDRQVRYRANFIQLFRPVVELPMVPIERKPVDGNSVEMLEQAVIFEE